MAFQASRCTFWVTRGCGPTLPHRTCGRGFPREASQLLDHAASPAPHMPVLTLMPADIQHIHTHAYTPTGTHTAPAHRVTCILTQTHQSAHTHPCMHNHTHPCARTLTYPCTDALSDSLWLFLLQSIGISEFRSCRQSWDVDPGWGSALLTSGQHLRGIPRAQAGSRLPFSSSSAAPEAVQMPRWPRLGQGGLGVCGHPAAMWELWWLPLPS